MNHSKSPAANEFPRATVEPQSRLRALHSRLWWITLLCLGIALYSAYHTHRPRGITIVVDFPEGHGLQAGDALRHRGIDIGQVVDVSLTSDLHGVRATIDLEQSAAGIAVEGSDFWIVRPLLSLTSVSGLETAVGHKYVAVHPAADRSTPCTRFQGRDEPPVVSFDAPGTEVVLRGEESFGINPGSPLTYRGIRVGQILAVELADTSQSVLVRVKVDAQYQSLLRQGSKFWKTSGVDVDFGLKGFHLSTESLTTLARGGVAFVTPDLGDDADLEPVAAGHEFTLAAKPEKSWLTRAANLSWRDKP